NKAKDWPRDRTQGTRGTDAGSSCGRHTTRFLHLRVMPMSLALNKAKDWPRDRTQGTRGTDAGSSCGRHTTRFLHL
ncbi:hypothetical protein C7E12_22585, partial [Stenotrophomonas maltophilia]